MQCQAAVELAHHTVWGRGQAESSWERVIELIRLQLLRVTTIDSECKSTVQKL